jgi:DNA repair exonuclease SbcCD ATPase subunit/DNA repair exonuclease SbcCD nuclease subunit
MIDTYTKLDVGFDKIKCIVHLADIHIRLTKRHEEYREAFEKLYDGIKKTPDNTLIVVAGDLMHSKIDLQPEAIQLASEFLKNLVALRPVILIAGNHDALLSNSRRLDSLTPIVDNLNCEKLFYLKKSGLFGAGNVLFNNMSIFDDPTTYLNSTEIVKSIRLKFDCVVALFHGPVDQAETDIGYRINNRAITTQMFEGNDIAMLGDIHMIQNLQEFDSVNQKPIIRYAGSLIMQNHGEAPIGHGYTVWNIDTRKFIHIEVPNDYSYFTVDVDDGKLITDISDIPAKPKLRVRLKETVATEAKKVLIDIRKVCDVTDLVYVRVDSDVSTKKVINQTVANLTQISNVDYQATLITDFLQDKFPDIDQTTIEAVIDINKTLNDALNKEDQSKNIRWKPKKFEFSNMFSYGEDNVIDFTKLHDVYGVFASNASGKSSLMEALSFCIFDKSAKTFKASQIINTEKMSFSCKFNFEINGVDFFIERKGSRDKKGNVKVDVEFYEHKLVDGVITKIQLNDEARRGTNAVIRDYLGTYDDFILTTLSLQKNKASFVDMGQTERKELLSQFIGLNLFDQLALITSDRIKEVNAAIKAFNKEDNTKKSADMSNELESLESKLIDLKRRVDEGKDSTASTLQLISEEQKKIIKLENVPLSIFGLQKQKQELESGEKQREDSITKCREAVSTSKNELETLKKSIDEYAVHDLSKKHEEASELTDAKETEELEFDRLKIRVQEKIKKLAHLDQHKYDPNCEFCMNNIFVKDAISTQESLAAEKATALKMVASISQKKEQLKTYDSYLEMKKKLDELEKKLPIIERQFYANERALASSLKLQEDSKNTLKKIIENIDLYEKSKEQIEINEGIQKTVSDLTQKHKNQSAELKKLEDEYLRDFARKTSLSDQIQIIKTRIEEIEILENEYSAFEYYSQAIGSNGVPYQIISEVIPQIESEVNNILNQIVDFSVSIETDGKNVNVYINYEDRKWPLELCSGMEQFIASLALRVALINVSNLPRSNFMVIDEGMSALDSSNFPMVHTLFDFMKKHFEFVIVISHLDAMRDMVNKQIEITKVDGFSKINHV